MKNYSIVRIGNEYVVQAGETSILKVASRRRAVKLISDAAELLGQQPIPSAGEAPSTACELKMTTDSAEVS
ncbi:hypothetical protein ACFIOY_12705 [Bradyrhizobium sp. TZ2]